MQPDHNSPASVWEAYANFVIADYANQARDYFGESFVV